jgi:hypothetical protein
MAEISSSRIEAIADPRPGSQEQPYQKPRVKAVEAAKAEAPKPPEIGAAEDDEKCQLDEMA